MDLKSSYPNNSNYSKAVIKSVTESVNYPQYEDESEVKILLMLSGGLESTALLANLLSYTRCQIHVHHVQLVNYSNKNQAQLNVMQPIIDYHLNNFREFTYSFSFVEEKFGGIYSCGFDSELWAYKAARICKSHRDIDIVMLGNSKFNASVTQASDIFKNLVFCEGFMSYKLPQMMFPLLNTDTPPTALDSYESIPSDIVDQCWTCNNPVLDGDNYVKCNICLSCQKSTFIKRDLWLKNEYQRHRNILAISWFKDEKKFLQLVKQENPDLVYLLLYALENNFPNRRIGILLKHFVKEIREQIANTPLLQDIIDFMVIDANWNKENLEFRLKFLVESGANLERVLINDDHHDQYFKEFIDHFRANLNADILTKVALSLEISDFNIERFNILFKAGAKKDQLQKAIKFLPELAG